MTPEHVRDNSPWEVRFAEAVEETTPPTAAELEVLRDLHTRTAHAHGASVGES
jgi:glutaconate CoA-transferase subunit B